MEKITEKTIPLYAENMQLWRDKLKEEVEKKHWMTDDLLGDGEPEKIEKALLFEHIPENEKVLYAETASRIAFGLMSYGQEGKRVTDNALYEIRRLASQIQTVFNDEALLHMLSFHIAREKNSNTYGNSYQEFSRIIQHAATKNLETSRRKVSEAFTNPFGLQDGMGIFRFNKEKEEIESFKIELMTEGTKGLVVFGDGEKGQEDLEIFNVKLSLGIYMKRDASNRLGGLERLTADTHIDKFHAGSVIKVDIASPLDDGQKIVELEVTETNIPELQEKYGDAYLGFIDKFPRDKGPIKLSLRMSNGKMIEVRDLNNLKIID